MAAGDVGLVLNRSQHQNEDTHVAVCDDVFSDAGSTPAASTTTFRVFRRDFKDLPRRSRRLHVLSKCEGRA